MARINLKFEKAKSLLQEGDILLFRGTGIISRIIRRAGEGEYSHVAVASGRTGMWECIEFREKIGGRTSALEQQIQQHNGMIDVFRPVHSIQAFEYDSRLQEVTLKYRTFDPVCVTNTMRKMTGLPYGMKRIWWIACRKLPFLRLFYSIESTVDDAKQDIIYPVCSTAVAYSFNQCGLDLMPHRSDNATEPNDIARSSLISYIFTLEI